VIPASPQAAAFRANPESHAIIRRHDEVILDVSNGWLSRFGLAHGEAVGRTLLELRIFPDAETASRFRSELGRSDGQWSMSCPLRDRAGTVTRGAVSVEPLTSHDEACWLVVVRDIVALSEDGSAALTHELNQPLAAIMANALAGLRFMNRDPIDTEELRSLLQDIVADGRRATEIISRLRPFLQGGVE